MKGGYVGATFKNLVACHFEPRLIHELLEVGMLLNKVGFALGLPVEGLGVLGQDRGGIASGLVMAASPSSVVHVYQPL